MALWGKCSGNAEPNDDDPVAGTAVVADGRAKDPGIVDPGTTAKDFPPITACYPSASIGWHTVVAVMPFILAPFFDIAMHLPKIEGVWPETADRQGLLPGLTFFAVTIGAGAIVVRIVSGDLRPPPKWRFSPGPAGIFPLRLAR